MPNKNYQKGRNFEYRVKGYLEKMGYYVVRSFASKGVFDLVAVPPASCTRRWKCEPLLIQCKYRDYVPPNEMTILLATAKRYRAISMIATRDARGHILFKELSL